MFICHNTTGLKTCWAWKRLWAVWRCHNLPLYLVINFGPCDAALGPIGQLQHIWSLSVNWQMSAWQLWWAGMTQDNMGSVKYKEPITPQIFCMSCAIIVHSSCLSMYIMLASIKLVRSKRRRNTFSDFSLILLKQLFNLSPYLCRSYHIYIVYTVICGYSDTFPTGLNCSRT